MEKERAIHTILMYTSDCHGHVLMAYQGFLCHARRGRHHPAPGRPKEEADEGGKLYTSPLPAGTPKN